MGRQIIKQPNGKYCIFSSTIDNITHYNVTVDEIIEEWVNEVKNDITEKVSSIINKLEKGEKPYHQFTMNYNEMIQYIKEVHGKKEFEEVKMITQ